MKEITQYKEIQDLLSKKKSFLLYASNPTCSVCASDQPKVEKIVTQEDFPGYRVNVIQVPEAAGQLSLLSSPALILFYQGREWHRQARIIDFQDLRGYIQQIKNSGFTNK